jgi:hypothetical protein
MMMMSTRWMMSVGGKDDGVDDEKRSRLVVAAVVSVEQETDNPL